MLYFKPFPAADESALKRFGGRAQTVVRRCTRTLLRTRDAAAVRSSQRLTASVFQIVISVFGARTDPLCALTYGHRYRWLAICDVTVRLYFNSPWTAPRKDCGMIFVHELVASQWILF